MKLNIFVIILLMFLIVSCEKNNPVAGSVSYGDYTYQSYDSLGNLIVNGWLVIIQTDSVHVQGTWSLNNLNNRIDIGPQQGSGQLAGIYTDSLISIDLYPDYRDHNVILNGLRNGNIIEGRWEWISFIGVTNWGTFRAVKD